MITNDQERGLIQIFCLIGLILVYQNVHDQSYKNLRGGNSRDAWRLQKTKKLPLKVVGTGLQNNVGKYRDNG